MSVRKAVLSSVLGVLLTATISLVPASPPALAAATGSTCSAEDIVPDNPDAPVTQPDTIPVMSGEEAVFMSVESNDLTSDGMWPMFCGYEPIPASAAKAVIVEDQGFIYAVLTITKTVTQDFSTTYYVKDSAGNVSAGQVTFTVTTIKMPVVKKVRHTKWRFTVKNVNPVALHLSYGKCLTCSALPRSKLIKPYQTVKLRGFSRIMKYSAVAKDTTRLNAEVYMGQGKLRLFKRRHK